MALWSCFAIILKIRRNADLGEAGEAVASGFVSIQNAGYGVAWLSWGR